MKDFKFKPFLKYLSKFFWLKPQNLMVAQLWMRKQLLMFWQIYAKILKVNDFLPTNIKDPHEDPGPNHKSRHKGMLLYCHNRVQHTRHMNRFHNRDIADMAGMAKYCRIASTDQYGGYYCYVGNHHRGIPRMSKIDKV